MAGPSLAPPHSDHSEIVRKRRFSVSSSDEVMDILDKLKRERFQGVVKFDIRCGGTVTSVEVEERSKVDFT